MSLKAAVGAVGITPPLGVELSGYGFYLERRATGVLDPLMARALVLEAEGERIAIVACDLLGVSRGLAQRTQAIVERRSGVPPHALMLACSHTHAGPAAAPVRGCGAEDPTYVDGLPQRLADAVAAAAERLQPAEVGFACGRVPGLGFNRVEGDSGPLDDSLVVMALRSASGSPLATVYHATAHGVTQFSRNTLVSADWPGAASRRIGELVGGEALYLAGASGDVNPVLAHTGRGDEAGQLVAERVSALLPEIEYSGDVAVRAAAQDVALPLAPIAPEELEALADDARRRVAAPDSPEAAAARVDLEWAEQLLRERREGTAREERVTEVQALRISEGLLLAHGRELFCEYGQALRTRFSPRLTFVVGYANDFIGYVPDPEDFARGGYAAATVPRICGDFPYTTDVGARLTAALADVATRAGA